MLLSPALPWQKILIFFLTIMHSVCDPLKELFCCFRHKTHGRNAFIVEHILFTPEVTQTDIGISQCASQRAIMASLVQDLIREEEFKELIILTIAIKNRVTIDIYFEYVRATPPLNLASKVGIVDYTPSNRFLYTLDILLPDMDRGASMAIKIYQYEIISNLQQS